MDVIGGACGIMAKKRTVHSLLLEKPEGNNSLCNVKMVRNTRVFCFSISINVIVILFRPVVVLFCKVNFSLFEVSFKHKCSKANTFLTTW